MDTDTTTTARDQASDDGKLYADADGKLVRVDMPLDTPYVFAYLYKAETDTFGTRRVYRETKTLSAI